MRSKRATQILCLALALSMTACGQGFTSASFPGADVSGVGSLTDTKAIESASGEAQTAIDDASALLASVDEGSAELVNSKALASEALNPAFVLDGFKGKLNEKLDAVLAKVIAAKAKFNEARLRVADALAKIDTSNPANAAVVSALTAQMAKLDQLEERFYTMIRVLTDRMDLASQSLDRLAAMAGTAAGSINPIFGGLAGLAAQYMISQIKDVIADVKAKLLAL